MGRKFFYRNPSEEKVRFLEDQYLQLKTLRLERNLQKKILDVLDLVMALSQNYLIKF